MSQIEFSKRRDVKATRKAHSCEACAQTIAAGSPAVYFVDHAEGDLYSAYYHPDCRIAEQAWNDHVGLAWDEFDPLWHLWDEGHEPGYFMEDVTDFRPNLQATWPAVYARLEARAERRSAA